MSKNIILSDGITSIKNSDFPTIDTDATLLFVPACCFFIQNYALRNLPELRVLWLPKSLTLISESAFSGLDKLEAIVIHDFETSSLGSVHYEYFDSITELFSKHPLDTYDAQHEIRKICKKNMILSYACQDRHIRAN